MERPPEEDRPIACGFSLPNYATYVLDENLKPLPVGMPGEVVIGGPGRTGRLPQIWSDDAAAVVETIEYLYALGHRRIARVGGLPALLHTKVRTDAFVAVSERLGLTEAATVLSDYSGEVVLVVNTASECGFTPQFAGLEQLWETYRDQGFTIIGIPCTQFGGQDPGTNEEIGAFCQRNYGVTFPMMAKIDVNGEDTHPVWQWLKSEKGGVFGDRIKWNFTKFLVGRDGHVIARYAPQAEPQSLAEDIDKALATERG